VVVLGIYPNFDIKVQVLVSLKIKNVVLKSCIDKMIYFAAM